MGDYNFDSPDQSRSFDENQGLQPVSATGVDGTGSGAAGATVSSDAASGGTSDDGVGNTTAPYGQAPDPITWKTLAQKAAFDKGGYFSNDNNLYQQRDGKTYLITGDAHGDQELSQGELVRPVSQNNQDQAGNPQGPSTSGDGGLMSNAEQKNLPPRYDVIEERKLSDFEKKALKAVGFTDEELDQIILHIVAGKAEMSRAMDGLTTDQNNIYLRDGVYDLTTPSGLAVLAHEVQHAYQYRNGMTYMRYGANSLGGYTNNKYEKEAYECQNDANNILRQRRKEDFQ